MFNKKWYKSKTMWASIIVALVTTIVPQAKGIVANNPEAVLGVIGFIFGLLRIKTETPVVLKNK